MGLKKRQKSPEAAAAVEVMVATVEEDYTKRRAKRKAEEAEEIRLPVMAQVSRVVEQAMRNITDRADVDLDVLQKSADEGMILSLEKCKEIVEHAIDRDLAIKAVKAMTGISNHLVARRRLKVENQDRVKVVIGGSIQLPRHITEGTEDADRADMDTDR